MKKLLSVLLAVLLTLCLSVPSLAYYTGAIPGLTREGNDVHIKTIITSTLTEPQKDFMRSWFAGGGGEKTMLLYQSTTLSPGLFFITTPSDSNLIRASDGSGGLKRFSFTKPSSAIMYRYDVDSKTYKFSSESHNFPSFTLIPAARIVGSFNDPLLDPEYQLDYDGDCLIDDDDGLLENPPSSSSSSSSSSSEPSEPPAPPYEPAPTPSMPSGGSDSPYIPYNPDVWWEAVSFIRSGAGAAGNILFLILAPFVLISLTLFFIRHYASGGKGGGGGKSI